MRSEEEIRSKYNTVILHNTVDDQVDKAGWIIESILKWVLNEN